MSSNRTYFKKLIDTLINIESITERLNHWYSYWISNKDNPDYIHEVYTNHEFKISAIEIPEKIYNSCFKEFDNTPEYQFWQLEYMANYFLKTVLRDTNIEEIITGPLAYTKIKQELQLLDDFEKNAIDLLNTGKITNKDLTPGKGLKVSVSEHEKEIEYLRIKDEYYKRHTGSNNTTTVVYANHVCYKKYLQEKLGELNKSALSESIIKSNLDILNLEDIFINPELKDQYLNILKTVSPAIVSNTNQYLLGPRSKGSIVAWVDILKSKSVIKTNLTDNALAGLLNSYIHGINFSSDGRSLRSADKGAAYIKYTPQILAHFNNISS